MRARRWLETLMQVSTQLIESRDYKKTLEIIVEQSAQLSGACRACVVIENTSGSFIIKAGYPEGGHGVDMIVTPALGGEFLGAIMQQGEIVVVENPAQDERTRYMEALARKYNLTKVIFLPLMYHGDTLGVLILDFQGHDGDTSTFQLEKIQLLANLASSAIGSEYERRRNEKKFIRLERMNAIGEESSRISHIFKNALWAIGPFVHRARRKATEGEGKEFEPIAESLGIVVEEIARLEHTVNGILRFSNPGKLHLEQVSINAFLREAVARTAGDMETRFELDPALDSISVNIDISMMSHVINDLVINAMQAKGTDYISVRNHFSSKRKVITMEIANNGEKIEIGMFDDIFSPFVTTKSSGTGLGLANVKSILTAHGGDIRLLSSTDEATIFELSLPL